MQTYALGTDTGGAGALTSAAFASDALIALGHLSERCRALEGLAQSDGADVSRQYHRTIALVHEICDAIATCELADVAPDDIRRAVDGARRVVGASPFFARLQRWPRGYAGDFETIEWLCRAENRAPAGTFAHAIESYALNAAISQQHRNKVSAQAAHMLDAFAGHNACRILSIGCGSSPDLRDVAGHVPPNATVVLCDSDQDALAYSRTRLPRIESQCHFVHGLVPRVLRRVREHGPFDLVMAGGLFDYLSDRFVVRTLSDAWNMLKPGGRIVFTNIAARNPFRVWIEYLGDWQLIERTEADITALCCEAGVSLPEMRRDGTFLAILATVTKPAG